MTRERRALPNWTRFPWLAVCLLGGASSTMLMLNLRFAFCVLHFAFCIRAGGCAKDGVSPSVNLQAQNHAPQTKLRRSRLVGLHDARRRAPGRCGPAFGRRFAAAFAARLQGRVLRHARGFLPGRGAGVHHTPGGNRRADNPVGICGPIGPTEQLPLVARLVNALELDVRSGHFWGMDEWYVGERAARRDAPRITRSRSSGPTASCASTASTAKLRMPDANLHFPKADARQVHRQLGRRALRRDARRPGRGQALGLQRSAASATGRWIDEPPPPAEYRKLTTRVVDLHPMTIIQNARTSGGGYVARRADAGASASARSRPGRPRR